MEETKTINFDLYTDGGATQSKNIAKGIFAVNPSSTGPRKSTAGSAAIVVGPDKQKHKLVAFLGNASDAEAELWGGIMGFSFIHNLIGAGKAIVTWHCDNKVVLETATKHLPVWRSNSWQTNAKEPVKNRRLWQTYLELTTNLEIIPNYIPAHKGHKQNEACDRACRWMIKSGEKLLATNGPGPIGQNKTLAPEQAWHLIDARPQLSALRD